MRTTIALLSLLAAATVAHGEAPLLSRLIVRASGPVEVAVPLQDGPQGPVYRTADGAWRPLEVAAEEGRARFSLPADAVGSTIVILQAPDWLVFDDATAPAVTSVTVDGQVLEPAAEMDLGHYVEAPGVVQIAVADGQSPIDVGAAVVTLDGTALPQALLSWAPADERAGSRVLQVRMGRVPAGTHTLKVHVPDAAPNGNVAGLRMVFASGPLVKDGGFEALRADGSPQYWTMNTWSSDAETKAELKVVQGGHSGEYCGELKGLAGALNLLFAQQIPLSAGKTYRVKLFYQATGSGGHLSMVNASKDEETKQYLNSPRLKPCEDWQPFEWEFTTKPSTAYNLYLRNAGLGSVKFDDVSVEEVREQ